MYAVCTRLAVGRLRDPSEPRRRRNDAGSIPVVMRMSGHKTLALFERDGVVAEEDS